MLKVYAVLKPGSFLGKLEAALIPVVSGGVTTPGTRLPAGETAVALSSYKSEGVKKSSD